MRMDDVDHFERFAQLEAAALARLAYRLTGHRESARDLVQEVLLDSFRHWSRSLRRATLAHTSDGCW